MDGVIPNAAGWWTWGQLPSASTVNTTGLPRDMGSQPAARAAARSAKSLHHQAAATGRQTPQEPLGCRNSTHASRLCFAEPGNGHPFQLRHRKDAAHAGAANHIVAIDVDRTGVTLGFCHAAASSMPARSTHNFAFAAARRARPCAAIVSYPASKKAALRFGLDCKPAPRPAFQDFSSITRRAPLRSLPRGGRRSGDRWLDVAVEPVGNLPQRLFGRLQRAIYHAARWGGRHSAPSRHCPSARRTSAPTGWGRCRYCRRRRMDQQDRRLDPVGIVKGLIFV